MRAGVARGASCGRAQNQYHTSGVHSMFAYVGGYTTPDRDGRGNGINVFQIDPVSGRWSHVQQVGGLENPSLFTMSRDGTRLYSVHGARTLVSAFAVDPH